MSRAPHLGRSGEWLCRPQESRQRPGPQPAPNQYHLLYRAYLLVAVRDELVSDEVQNPSATSITQYCTAPIVHPIQQATHQHPHGHRGYPHHPLPYVRYYPPLAWLAPTQQTLPLPSPPPPLESLYPTAQGGEHRVPAPSDACV